MIRYARYSRPELRQFLRDLHLGAQSTGKNLNKALKPDLLRALREADASRTFRFLDLPPELRTTIYRELLVIEGSSTSCSSPKCHPQILRTSKKVNQEASGILYGDNVIEVKGLRPRRLRSWSAVWHLSAGSETSCGIGTSSTADSASGLAEVPSSSASRTSGRCGYAD